MFGLGVFIYFLPKKLINVSLSIDQNSVSPYNISTKPNRQVTGIETIIY